MFLWICSGTNFGDRVLDRFLVAFWWVVGRILGVFWCLGWCILGGGLVQVHSRPSSLEDRVFLILDDASFGDLVSRSVGPRASA